MIMGDFMKLDKRFSDKPDMILLICSFVAALFGIFVINSASYSLNGHFRYVTVQIFAFFIGIVAMLAITLFKYKSMEKISPFIFGGSILLLLSVLALGKLSHGTQGWLVIGPLTLQPSEIVKLFFIVTLAHHISLVREKINSPKALFLLVLHLLSYIIPILLQPDFGTATVFCFIFVCVLFFSGLNRKYIISAFCALLAALPIGWFFLKDFQKRRIISFLNPESDPTNSGYHILQSQLSIGSGKLFGRGYLNGPQTQFGYLPEKQTDFIFSVIGEELGLVGTLFTVVLLFIIIYRCFDNARSFEHDSFGEIICVGVGAMLFFHTVENIGMCIGLLPITGIPLPFISYGGSNLVTSLCAVGLVQSVVVRRRQIKFNL